VGAVLRGCLVSCVLILMGEGGCHVQSKRVKPKVEKWKSETDPGGRTFWRCETLGLTCWKKPSEDELALANMKHWVEMANPDGQRCVASLCRAWLMFLPYPSCVTSRPPPPLTPHLGPAAGTSRTRKQARCVTTNHNSLGRLSAWGCVWKCDGDMVDGRWQRSTAAV